MGHCLFSARALTKWDFLSEVVRTMFDFQQYSTTSIFEYQRRKRDEEVAVKLNFHFIQSVIIHAYTFNHT